MQDPSAGLYRTHSYTVADTDIDTDGVFGDTASRTQAVTFAFAILRSGASEGIVLDFGSAARGVAVWLDGADVGVAAGAGTGAADDGVTLLAEDALPVMVANGTLTLTGNAANTQTVTIGSRTYTFQTVLTNVAGNVLIGASASDSLDNLIASITAGAGSGTLYAAATTVHPDLTASAGSGDTMVVSAKLPGSNGNKIGLSETLASGSWSYTSLRGGVDALKFVVSVVPGTGTVELFRNGALVASGASVSGSFDGSWADDGNGAIGAVQGAVNDRVPVGSRIALANASLVGPVSVFLHQRAGA